MLAILKILHVLAVGLWFGTTVFFSFVVGLSLITTFTEVAAKKADERPVWFPVAPAYDKDPPPSPSFPNPVRTEQGSAAFGAAIAPLFGWFFLIQGGCALVALATALPGLEWPAGKVRVAVLVLAALTLAVGWWMAEKVSGMREGRSQATLTALADPTSANVVQADVARGDFARWHGYSVMLNLVTVVLVTVAMGLAAFLPAGAKATHAPPLVS
jgi:acyl phosphate:glycerol-3-phosphate acyltransferase